MKTNQNSRQKIRDYISGRLTAKNDMKPFDDSASLVSSGRLDSLDVIEIVVFLEDEFGLNFARIGFDQSHVDSVNSIMKLLGPGT